MISPPTNISFNSNIIVPEDFLIALTANNQNITYDLNLKSISFYNKI